ncbi:hypothetical protein KIH39_16270 [Telmatocola sphagniphila]|uniref:Uncharacterized protein n=1 Tax=Telmatocola sphagniphila TaxID=1123043 RepID=A0A8E6B1P1_9BACT|nr:hypothetical protein [Telmatocola sphagniphila]QVL30405.1 hypothetical protein KIH39_16270 [Telmatocola sphagniphila]
MARMSREFSLVLLGAGVMTAGYFLYPEPALDASEKQQEDAELAQNGVDSNTSSGGGSHSHFFWYHTGYGYGSGSRSSFSSASSAVRSGGFGSFGRGAAGA